MNTPGTSRFSTRRPHGFTAVEVLVASIILGLALAPVLSLFPSSSRQALFSEAHVQALAAAEQAYADWEAQAITGRYETDVTESLAATVATSSTGSCPAMALHVTALEVPEKAGLWRISVQVEWETPTKSGQSTSHVTVERLFSKPALALDADYELTPVRPAPSAGGPQA